MIPNDISKGTKVIHKTFDVGTFKGFYCDYPLWAIVEYQNGLWRSFKKDELEIYNESEGLKLWKLTHQEV